jgi:hypothetical protein
MIDTDEIGTLYTTETYNSQGHVDTPSTELPGYHVNTTFPVGAWAAFRVFPTTPSRVFGGHETHFYAFEDRAAYVAVKATVDLMSLPLEIPRVLTRAQAKLALLGAGLLGSVQPAIDAVADPAVRASMQIEWDDRLTFERTNPMLGALATGMGMTSDQLDQLFIAGATL